MFLEMTHIRILRLGVVLLNLIAINRACAQPGHSSPCGPFSFDSTVITCWLNTLNEVPRMKAWEESMPILRTLSTYTARYPILEARRLRRMGRIYFHKMIQDSALYCLTAAERIFLQHHALADASILADDIGSFLVEKNESAKAAQYFYTAIERAEKCKADTLKIFPLLNLAAIFEKLGDTEKEKRYLLEAYLLSKKYNNPKKTAISGVSLMMSYIETADLDSAKIIADHVLQNMPGNSAMKACSYYSLAVWESAQGNWNTADHYYRLMKNDPHMVEHFRHVFSFAYANFLADRNLHRKAQPIFEDVIVQAKKYQNLDNLNEALKKYHISLAAANDFKGAYKASLEYMAVRDSVHHIQIEERIRDINIKYETAEKEKALQISKLALSEKTNQRNLLLGGFALFSLLGGAAFFWQRNRIMLTQKLREKEAQIAQHKIAQLKQEQMHLAFKAMVSGEEAERNRLARELHDGLGGILSGIKLALTTRKKNGHETDHRETVNMVDKAGSELRRIAQNLMPEALTKFGLVAALEDLCGDLEHYGGLKTEFLHYGLQHQLPEHILLPVYRIVQESLNNIIKHAKATEVMVELIYEKEQLHLTIEDNGVGFQPNSEQDIQGQGLKNIGSRVQYLHGSLELDSAPGQGSTINITIPIEHNND
jgi:signal transduction histidine kinase